MEILKKEKKRYRHKFEYLLARYRKNKGYDFLVCYSGGKDSTYILDIFKNHYNLRILAITMDNGFISPVALENIRRVVETIGVDHLFFKPKFELLKRIFSRAAIEVFYSRKSLERASTICTSCIGIVKFVALRIAIEQEIPFIGYGWSPGQAPLQSSVMRTNPILIRATQKTLQEPLVQRFGDEVNAYFLEERHFTEPDRFPYNIHPLAFLEYNEEKIYKRVAELGWKKPKDTDPNSTNCLLNAYANYVHQQQFGYNPYVFEIAKMVREGIMSREEGLLRVSGSPQIEQINLIEERLKL
jgi:tRNA(Ile)-lysidine synthase TilS/MesJ